MWTKNQKIWRQLQTKKVQKKVDESQSLTGFLRAAAGKKEPERPKKRHGATGNDSVERRRVSSAALSLDLSVGGDLLRRRRLLRSAWVSLLNLPPSPSQQFFLSVPRTALLFLLYLLRHFACILGFRRAPMLRKLRKLTTSSLWNSGCFVLSLLLLLLLSLNLFFFY